MNDDKELEQTTTDDQEEEDLRYEAPAIVLRSRIEAYASFSHNSTIDAGCFTP